MKSSSWADIQDRLCLGQPPSRLFQPGRVVDEGPQGGIFSWPSVMVSAQDLRSTSLCVVLTQSVRRATIGSIPEAREAGIKDATRAAKASNNVASISMTGSQGATSNN